MLGNQTFIYSLIEQIMNKYLVLEMNISKFLKYKLISLSFVFKIKFHLKLLNIEKIKFTIFNKLEKQTSKHVILKIYKLQVPSIMLLI